MATFSEAIQNKLISYDVLPIFFVLFMGSIYEINSFGIANGNEDFIVLQKMNVTQNLLRRFI